MRTSAILLLGIMATALSCNNPQKPASGQETDSVRIKHDADKLDEVLKKIDPQSQIFSAPGNELSLVRGKKGTVIFLSPDDLETEDGQAPSNKVIVELKELTSTPMLARANAQTISNGSLLVSGGAYYINITSDGKQLKLKKDKELKVAFPKITDSSMSVFYGQRDSQGRMNWQPTNQSFTSKNGYGINTADTMADKSIMVYNSNNYRLMGYVGNDSTYKRDTASLSAMKRKDVIENNRRDSISREKMQAYIKATKTLNESLYDITSMKKLGWINCDRFYKEKERTSITYTISPKDSISYARVFLVYKDINAVVDDIFVNIDGSGTRYFQNAPIGYKGRLIAVTNKNNELMVCKMDITVVKNQNTLIVWKKTTTDELNGYFDPNNNWGQL